MGGGGGGGGGVRSQTGGPHNRSSYSGHVIDNSLTRTTNWKGWVGRGWAMTTVRNRRKYG